MKKKKHIAVYVLILFLTSYVFWPIHTALTVADGKKGTIILALPMEIGERLAMQFIHSIHKTPVYEEYYIDDNLNIVLDKVIYESYGVGNPSSVEPGQTYRFEDGKYIIGNLDRRLPYFDQAIGQVVANHQLIIKGEWLPLSKLNPPGSWVRIQVKRVSLVTLWEGDIDYGR